MRRYGRVEALAVILMGLMLAAVLYATAGCSERRTNNYTTAPRIEAPAPAPGDTCDHHGHGKHLGHGKPKGRN